MFGYLQIHKDELKVKEYEAYKSVYCGLCKQLGKDYCFLTRLILSYDCTFYSIMLMSLKRTCTGFADGRCKFNPLKKCKFAKCRDDALSKAAALSVISAYYKILDDIGDSGFFRKTACRIIKPLFHHWKKKAAKRYPEIEKTVSGMMQNQSDVEKDPYVTDAADDYEKDKERKNFNPFIASDIFDKEYIGSVLSQSLARAYDAYNLLDIIDFKPIIENTLIYGLPNKQNAVLKIRQEVKDE